MFVSFCVSDQLPKITEQPHGPLQSLCCILIRIHPTSTPLSHGQISVLLVDGTVVCQQSSGSLSQQRLRTHEMLTTGTPTSDSLERQRHCFRQALGLNRFQLAFKVGLQLNQKDLWLAMGRRCLECLDVAWAKKAYRQGSSAGMVLYLEKLQNIEDKQLLSGLVLRFVEHRFLLNIAFGKWQGLGTQHYMMLCPRVAVVKQRLEHTPHAMRIFHLQIAQHSLIKIELD